jgi:ferredoxin-NADP reductase
MAGYQSKLLNRFAVAQDTMAFHFEKPPGFDFKPGQSTDVILMNPRETDAEGNARTSSIASAPFGDQLMFVTCMRDTAFKRSLTDMRTLTRTTSERTILLVTDLRSIRGLHPAREANSAATPTSQGQ